MTDETPEQRRELNRLARLALLGEDDGERIAVPSERSEAERIGDLARFALGSGGNDDRLVTEVE